LAAYRDVRSFPTRRSSDLGGEVLEDAEHGLLGGDVAQVALTEPLAEQAVAAPDREPEHAHHGGYQQHAGHELAHRSSLGDAGDEDRKSTRLNSSHVSISYA